MTSQKITNAVAQVYGTTTQKLQSLSQTEPLPEARKMLVYLMFENGFTAPETAKAINRSKNYVYRVLFAIRPLMKVYNEVQEKHDKILILIKSK